MPSPSMRRTIALALSMLAIACASPPEGTDVEIGATSSAALLGSDVVGPPRIVQRNAALTQRFRPSALTPDGRLGLVYDSDPNAGFTLVALGDPLLTPTPAFIAAMTDTAISSRLPFVRSPFAGTPADPQNSARTIASGDAYSVWDPSGSNALVFDPRISLAGKPVPVRDPDACALLNAGNLTAYADPTGRYDCYRLIHYQPFGHKDPGDGHTDVPMFQAELMAVVDARRPSTLGGVPERANPLRIVHASVSSYRLAQAGNTFVHAMEMSATADARLVVAQRGVWTFNETPWNPMTWTIERPLHQIYDAVMNNEDGLKRICRRISAAGMSGCFNPATDEDDFARVYTLAAGRMRYAEGSAPWGPHSCGYMWITPEGTDVFCRPWHHERDGIVPRQSFESSTGIQYFSVGQHTSWMWQRLDGGINTRRFNPDRVTASCLVSADPESCPETLGNQRPFSPLFLNTSTGFWAQNRGRSTSMAFPVLRQWPLFQFMTLDNSLNTRREELRGAGLLPSADTALESNMRYWEASFACGISPTCLLHLPMHEMEYRPDDWEASPPILRARAFTQDNSNNLPFFAGDGAPIPQELLAYFGSLQGDARFIGEVFGPDQDERYLSGYRGTGIALPQTGSIAISARSPDVPCRRGKGCLTNPFPKGFTAELAVLPLFSVASASFTLAEHYGLWSLKILNGMVQGRVTLKLPGIVTPTTVQVNAPFTRFASLADQPGTLAPKWTHLALRASPQDGTVTLYVDGVQAAQAVPGERFTLTPVGAAVDSTIVRVGPSGTCAGCPAASPGTPDPNGTPHDNPILFVDELRIHSVPLAPQELAAVANADAGARRTQFLSPQDVVAAFSSYFSRSNPRQLTLSSAGVPLSLDPSQVRIPAALGPYVYPPGAFPKLVDAGEALFKSPVLSTNAQGVSQTQLGTGKPMACATCHDPAREFTDPDGRRTAVGVQAVGINTPSIVNRAFGTNQFFARRAEDLIDLATRPVKEPTEMNGNVPKILQRINTGADQAALRSTLQAVFGAGATITEHHLKLALTAYEVTQLTIDSAAETVLAGGRPVPDGQGGVFRPEVVRLGKLLFEGKARCTACHTGPNFSDELAHDTGVVDAPGAFKTPSLWGVVATAPYFHDGSRDTLRQVLEFYNAGGRGMRPVQPGVPSGLHIVDPELRPLALTEDELRALEVYLRSLVNVKPLVASGYPTLTFSNHGQVPGLTCVSVSEPDSGWDDNFICSVGDVGLKYVTNGSLPAGMRCTQIVEPAAPQGIWNNSYACVPSSSTLNLQWSYGGQIAGKACTPYLESPEFDSWGDNYLCWDEPLRLSFSSAGPIGGLTCTLVDEPGDTHGWNDNYVCANKDIGLSWFFSPINNGMRCTVFDESLDHDSWGDNRLCVPSTSNVSLEFWNSRPPAGLTCVSVNEPADPDSWADNYLCYHE